MAKSIDYGDILKRAKVITFKNKWLWVYGLVLAMFEGGNSGNGGGGGSSSTNSTNKIDLPKELPENLPETTKQVLGAATDNIKDWALSVPVSTWVLLGVGLLIAIVLGVIISIIVRNWAKAAMISGINIASTSTAPITLAQTAPAGRKYMKNLFLLELIGGIIGLCVVLVFVIPLFLLILAKQIVLAVLIGIVAGLALLILFIIFAFVSIYAERLVVLHNFAPLAAWKRGLKLAKSSFIPTFVMGILNMAIGCVTGCLGLILMAIIAIVPGLIIFWPVFQNGLSAITPAMIVSGVILILIVSNIQLLISAGLMVFNYSTWNLFVKEIVSDEKDL